MSFRMTLSNPLWLSKIFNDKKRRAVSLRQPSFLFEIPCSLWRYQNFTKIPTRSSPTLASKSLLSYKVVRIYAVEYGVCKFILVRRLFLVGYRFRDIQRRITRGLTIRVRSRSVSLKMALFNSHIRIPVGLPR